MRSTIVVVQWEIQEHMQQGRTGQSDSPRRPMPAGQTEQYPPNDKRIVDGKHSLPRVREVEIVKDNRWRNPQNEQGYTCHNIERQVRQYCPNKGSDKDFVVRASTKYSSANK